MEVEERVAQLEAIVAQLAEAVDLLVRGEQEADQVRKARAAVAAARAILKKVNRRS